jgi:DNA-nicking Smr family endonuclease
LSKKRHEEPVPKAPVFKNDAFKKLLEPIKKAAAETKAPTPPPRPAPPRPSKAARASADDEALFLLAMEDVSRLPSRPGVEERPMPSIQRVDEDAEALARLAELVATGEGLDLADTDEYAEGLARGVDPSLLVGLRRGDYSVQGHVDLHGLGAEAAKEALERFLVESRRRGRRCVLVVHGRGLHSRDQIPVIKERMGAWLSRGRLSKMVLAFATARPTDGGAGASYVLLRR